MLNKRIILVSGLNESEVLRTLAKYGISSINLYIKSAVSFSSELLKMKGTSNLTYISREEEVPIIYNIAKDNPYFKGLSYSDTENLSSAIRTLRMLIRYDEDKNLKESLSQGEFKDKNDNIYEVYSKYIKYLKSHNLIDSIGLIRTLIDSDIDCDFTLYSLKEFKLLPLEDELLKKFNGKEIEIEELFKIKEGERYRPCFISSHGESNEISYILSDILECHIPFDRCTLLIPDKKTYVETLYDISKQYDIPVTFGTGVPLNLSNPGVLLKLLTDYDKLLNFKGEELFYDILNSGALDLDKLKEKIGILSLNRSEIAKEVFNLKLGFDEKANLGKVEAALKVLNDKLNSVSDKDKATLEHRIEVLNTVKSIGIELGLGIGKFINQYVRVRDYDKYLKALDKEGLDLINRYLNIYEDVKDDIPLHKFVENILGNNILQESSKEGHLHITTLNQGFGVIRENMYFMGLSSERFPGHPRENYLYLDSDLKYFEGDYTSRDNIKRKVDSFFSLFNLCTKKQSRITLSYSNHGLVTLKDTNPSSVLFKLYRDESGKTSYNDFLSSFKEVGFKDNKLNLLGGYIKEVIDRNEIEYSSEIVNNYDKDEVLSREFSPSAIEKFIKCPRSFYFRYIMGLEDKNDYDPALTLNPLDFGNLSHEGMEYLGKNISISKEDFMKEMEKLFDSFIMTHIPSEKSYDKDRDEFLFVMDKAYDSNHGKDILLSETELKYEFEDTGIKLKGYPDRIEKNSDGTNTVVDYKTGDNINHKTDDTESCIQVAIYAYLCEKNGIPISQCEYRYLRNDTVVTYDHNKNWDSLKFEIDMFKKALKSGEFGHKFDDKNCKFCSYIRECKTLDRK